MAVFNSYSFNRALSDAFVAVLAFCLFCINWVENAQLKKRIRDLEKALEFSRLETQARDMMIDKAEEYFDIPIRKKSGAK